MSMSENEIGGIIVDRALRVHPELSPGLLESTYEACLCHELREAGLDVEVQFNVKRIKEGIRRVVNQLSEETQR